ncbi:keratinocyte-associated protein 3-like isoform X2 [Clupea harengus]|uniref:Keratinocyte-associated protein 3-like isoform X2 n=1 Tax=Clupea harengus TaxID=7950 RepID=A0A6P8H2S6_CLUHA|nr:keratinocyte-associated protein 3-like isoform X2 [Clupea harengus]
MAKSGGCCGGLEEPKALMKFGLSVVLIGHVNFLLGALVHGAVLRHINLHPTARGMEYAISNVISMVAGLTGVIIGILAIVLSKNNSRRALTWGLWALSLVSALLAAASAVGLLVSTVRAIINRGRSLLTHCRFPDAIGSYSYVTNECPFDPTRIYSTTLILWVPLIVMSVVQVVFSSWSFSACSSFLGLPCCPRHKPPREVNRPPPRGHQSPNGNQACPPEHHELLAQHHQTLPHHSSAPTHSQPSRASQLSRDSFWI